MNHSLKEKYHEVREIKSLKDLLDSSVKLYANRPAFLVKKEKGGEYYPIQYLQVKNDVDALGTKLIDMGLKDAKIAVIGENCYEWIISYFAVVNGTGVVVPLDKELSKEEIYNLLRTADCRAVFFTKGYEEYFADFDIDYKIRMKTYGDRTDLSQPLAESSSGGEDGKGILDWESMVAAGEKLLHTGNHSFVDAEIDPYEMKVILFTSGTTDAAKGVMLCHHNITTNIMDTCKIAYITPEDRSLSILPIHHTFESTMGMLLILYRGASAAFYEGLKYVNKNLAEAQATVLIGVPLIFESIYDKIWKQAEKTGKANQLRKAIKLNKTLKAMGIDTSKKLFKSVHEKFGGKLRLVISGAAAIDPKVLRGFEDLGFKMLQGYGLTECSPLVSGSPDFCNNYKKAGSVGPAVSSGEIKIVDKDEDGIGEIIFKGPNVMLGYYNMPDKTAEVLKDGWFYTGDLGFLDEEGWLYITGRKKNVIVTKTGKNIYPEEVEYYINRNKYIQESLVHGTFDEDNDDTQVSAQVRPNYDVIYEEFGESFGDEEVQSLIKRVISEINEKLPIYKRVRNIAVRKDEFIKTTTKKIQRHKNL
ncbi:AMP-dependent synthetase/ligase [Sinanaerobacter chloroacetimidivorans]|uniref:AMP-binding protein n=1 Tax=Sinanaerobacter chloroacetimidivorans TaxID=2818044 RepID=A0A8J7VZ61_9FIRM|nr:AMP-binding protein [Sinanaerobacter chloroacetimidivorans]MBR0596313.1 AMP-binding protein [Sinanaerobacter chloroacetimidivorans]